MAPARAKPPYGGQDIGRSGHGQLRRHPARHGHPPFTVEADDAAAATGPPRSSISAGHVRNAAFLDVRQHRYRGTCYFAANWQELGWTTGRGKDSVSMKPNRSLEKVLGYPLTRRFREQLAALS
jgi:hypothetical protein